MPKSQPSMTANGEDKKINRLGIDIGENQAILYRFFVDIVKYYPPEDVIIEFRKLFFEDHSLGENAAQYKALSKLILANNEKEFVNTLKRCCYILINNWSTQRKFKFIKELVDLFENLKLGDEIHYNPNIHRRQIWLYNFISSHEYQDLKIFASQYEERVKPEQIHWTERYSSYLLASQYLNSENPKEQQEAALVLAQNLKRKFKFDLAMYTARSQCRFSQGENLTNPTALGDDVLKLIKIILAKRQGFNYINLAHIFVRQTQNINYFDFKKSLWEYLIFRLTNREFFGVLKSKLLDKILTMYPERDDDNLNDALFLRSCNKLCDYLTSENGQDPSDLFVHLTAQNNPLSHGVLLLKLILISPNSRNHLERRIADLIKFYQDYSEEDCQWIVNFLDIINVTFALYVDQDVQYDVVQMKPNIPKDCSEEEVLQYYRIFSQSRGFSQAALN